MAKIPLRAYNREIEGMIDRGQASQAVDHCLHILKFFPKHIDTYRLLGKAFLEMQKYSDAADVLQRVLACIPDDFISQVGMAIIREDEGNLNAAIWHMERAFEVQPSNIGVREELRRLYGRRDGTPPDKIRLTRGALVRMYARGELYQQAIAEIRVALLEEPQRVDLETLLARMYYLSGQKVAATEVCTRLIGKLPFCFEANRILAEVLPGSARSEDAKHYLARIHAMDPYLAHLTPEILTSAEVPENAVELERLEWMPEHEAGRSADWAKTLEAQWGPEGEAIPDWITGAISGESAGPGEEKVEEISEVEQPAAPDEIKAVSPFTVEITPEEEPAPPASESESAAQIPDWMQEAGWMPASGETPEEPSSILEGEEPSEEEAAEEIEQAEIPEWLAALAPSEPEEPEEPESTEWLKSILPTEPGAEPETPAVEESLAQEAYETETGAFGALEELGEETEEVQPPEGEQAEAMEFAAEVEEPLESSALPVEEQPEEVAGEIVAETEPFSAGEPAEPVGPFIEEPSAELPTEPAADELQPPDWLAELQTPVIEPAVPGETEIPSWLEELSLETPETAPESSEIAATEWLKAGPTEFAAGIDEETVMEESEKPPQREEEFDLGDTQPIKPRREEPPAPVSEPEIEQAPEEPAGEPEFDQTMSWLERLTAKEAGEEEKAEAPAEQAAEPAPDWIQELTTEEETAREPFEEKGEPLTGWMPEAAAEKEWAPEGVEGAGEPSPEWAQEPGAEAQAGPEQPEAAGEFLPEWMQEAAAEEAGQVSPEEIQPFEEALPAGEEPESIAPPDITLEETEGVGAIFDEEFHREEPVLSEAEVEQAIPSPEEIAEELPPEMETAEMELGAGDQFLEALEALQPEAKPGIEQPEETPPVFEAEAETAEGAALQVEPAEFQPEPAGEEAEMLAEEELPEWLRQMMAGEEEEITPPAEVEAAQPAESPAGESLGWLQELAAEEGAPSEEPPGEAAIEEAEAPSILGAFAEDESILKPEAAVEEGLPDWLRGVDEEKLEEEPLAEFRLDQITAEAGVEEAEPGWTPEMAASETPSVIEPSVEDTAPFKPLPGEGEPETTQTLRQAQAALEAHNVERALENYDQLIKSGQHLEEIIHDLRDALYRYPIDVSIWQLLGDAYMKSNRLQDALDAYTKAEELLR